MVEQRLAVGMTQRDVAAKLKRPPSYVAKTESFQRRLDVIEMVDMLEAIGVRPEKFLATTVADLRKRRD